MNCWPNTLPCRHDQADLCRVIGIGTYTTCKPEDRFYGTRLPNLIEAGIPHLAVVEKYSGEVYAAYILHTTTNGLTYGTRIQYSSLQAAADILTIGCYQ